MRASQFRVGDRARILRGSFRGRDGIVEAVDVAARNVRLMVTLFGREVAIDVRFADFSRSAAAKVLFREWKGALEGYRARWHALGFPQQMLEAGVCRTKDGCAVEGTEFGMDTEGVWRPSRKTGRELAPSEWQHVITNIFACRFWELAPEDTKHCGLDGETWTLEGARVPDGIYHSVHRWSTGIGPALYQACADLAERAGVWPYAET
jgi:hypothetical protein